MVMRRVAEKCYLPMNELLMKQIEKFGDKFKVAFSFSGIAIEQMEQYAPDVLESFRKLVATGHVEVLSETYAHSLASLNNPDEFKRQVTAHKHKMKDVFGVTSKTFRNTELIYSDEIGAAVADMGYNLMLTEGAKHILGWKSPNYMYANAINPKLKVLLRNFKFSDEIAFRFVQDGFRAEDFVNWLNALPEEEEVVNIFMDYETFGEHQSVETGIFNFMECLPEAILKGTKFKFATPQELAKKLQPVSAVNVPNVLSWSDEERDLTAWLGNPLQDDAYRALYDLSAKVHRIKDEELQQDWLELQTSDHFYYMCTKWLSDGVVHKYFSPYASPYDAYINYMNVLTDFADRVKNLSKRNVKLVETK
jgi:alpha-amylase